MKMKFLLLLVLVFILIKNDNIDICEVKSFEENKENVCNVLDKVKLFINDINLKNTKITISNKKDVNEEEYENEIINLTNEYRKEQNIGHLEKDEFLTIVARQRAYEAYLKWGHERKDGSYVSDILKENNYKYSKVGENLGKYQKTPNEVLQMWKESKAHNEIMLMDFTKIGVGVYQDENGKLYYAQIFSK